MESVFMIRSGEFGENFGNKFIMAVVGIIACVYDWRSSKTRRRDYFYVYICGDALWLTTPLQGMSEGATVGVVGLLFGDRITKSKKWLLGFILWWLSFIPLYLGKGINYDNVNVGDLDIPSRRNMFPIGANLAIFCMCSIAFIWFYKSAKNERKRGWWMYIVMASTIAWWTFWEWLSGQRWIEVGKKNYEDGTFSDLRRASPLLEFLALMYDYAVEVSLIYIPFLAIPYFLGLIKPKKKEE